MERKQIDPDKVYLFRESLIGAINEYAKKHNVKASTASSILAKYIPCATNTVCGWMGQQGRDSYPDVEQGFYIAQFFMTNVQKMVTGEDPANIYDSHIIRQIVDDLEICANNPDFLLEIRGIVRHYIDTHRSECADSEPGEEPGRSVRHA